MCQTMQLFSLPTVGHSALYADVYFPTLAKRSVSNVFGLLTRFALGVIHRDAWGLLPPRKADSSS